MRMIKRVVFFLMVFFVIPSGLSLVWWANVDRPRSWSEADWNASGLLKREASRAEAMIKIMAARTGGIKGALSVHTWVLVKREGEQGFDRYDKVGWGRPIRKNAYAADARWYSNEPWEVVSVTGARAQALIPKVEAAIESYPYNRRGGYGLWPGPNSNSFVAHVTNAVPELGTALPPHAVGRSFLPGDAIYRMDSDRLNLQIGYRGLIGMAVGRRHGFEIHFMGLAAGLDVLNPALKLPGIGRIGVPEIRAVAQEFVGE